MQNATKYLTADEQQQVEVAVRDAEQQTSAEIVAVVASESGRYDRAESIVGLIGSVLGLIVLHGITSPPQEAGSWTVAGAVSITWQVLAVVVGFVSGSLLASYFHPIRRLFVMEREIDDEVSRAAHALFASQRIRSARGAGGLLFYVSLFEHRAVVLADEGLLSKLDAEFPARLRDVAIGQLRAGNRAATFLETVKAAARELSGALPKHETDTDELPNHLVCIHPRP